MHFIDNRYISVDVTHFLFLFLLLDLCVSDRGHFLYWNKSNRVWHKHRLLFPYTVYFLYVNNDIFPKDDSKAKYDDQTFLRELTTIVAPHLNSFILTRLFSPFSLSKSHFLSDCLHLFRTEMHNVAKMGRKECNKNAKKVRKIRMGERGWERMQRISLF